VNSTKRRLLVGVAALYALALILRLCVIGELAADPFFTHRLIDEIDYHALAVAFSAGKWPSNEALFRPPLYPILLGVIYRVVGTGILGVKMVQALLGSLIVPLTTYVGWRTLRSSRAALACGAIVALAAPLIYYDLQLLAGSLDALLTTAGVAAVLFALAQRRDGFWALPGLLFGLAAINRGNALILAFAVIVWLARSRTKRAVAAFAVAALIPIAPLGWHNGACDERPEAAYALVSLPAPASCNSGFTLENAPLGWADGINLYLGNVPDLADVNRNDHLSHFDAYRKLVIAPWRAGVTRASGHSSYFRRKTLSSIGSAPGAWLALMARKLAETLNGYEVPRGTTLYADREDSLILSALAWTKPLLFPSGILLPLAALGAAFLRSNRRWNLIALLFGLQLVTVALFFVTSRYRLPAVPLAAVLAVGFVRRMRRHRPSWRVVAVAIPLLVLANIRFPNAPAPVRSSGEHFGLAQQLAAEGDRPEAEAHFRAAMELEPRDARATMNLGRLLQDDGKIDDAIDLYRRAIAIEPTALSFNNLGTALLAKKDLDGAEAAFRAAIDADPSYERARTNLGIVERLKTP
jgi:4-amino-4-deoxy-L-arabinose transferase-like glycosyltransferase